MIWQRKLGVFELLFGLMLFELFVGSRIRALAFGLTALLALYTKKKFGGEFSLSDAWSVATGAGKQVVDAVEKDLH